MGRYTDEKKSNLENEDRIIGLLKCFITETDLYYAAEKLLQDCLGIKLVCNAPDHTRDDYFESQDSNYQYVSEAVGHIEHIYPMGDISKKTLKKSQTPLEEARPVRYEAIQVFACESKQGELLKKAEIEALTRAFNRANSIDDSFSCTRNTPVLVIIRHGGCLSISLCERTPQKNHDSVGKVIMRHNIDCMNPKKGHIQILSEMRAQIRKSQTFDALYDTLLKAISVDIVSDSFFAEYQRIYKAIVDCSIKDEHIRKEFVGRFPDYKKAIRDYVKMLMGRLVFIQFLQRKGWMGAPAGDSWSDGDPEFIQNLFDQSPNKEAFVPDVLNKVFRDLNTEREGDLTSLTESGNVKIPYLNGGLFGDDDFADVRFCMPEGRMKELLDFFRSYKFTIDESASDAVEVGIDPEMLGRIFENLLEDNNATGAFYTPKEVVEYMCREALIKYLEKGSAENDVTRYRDFVSKHDTSVLDAKDKEYIQSRLKVVRICDPAIGSGAFPMGMLKELLECRKVIEMDLSPETVDISAIKKDIIQNSIYGVDIEKGAVDIARLRFWLSLIIDEETPHALPNMDFKIMQGNSLFPTFEGQYVNLNDRQRHVNSSKIRAAKKELTRLQSLFYEADGLEKKELMVSIKLCILEIVKLQMEYEYLAESDRNAASMSIFDANPKKITPVDREKERVVGVCNRLQRDLKNARKSIHERSRIPVPFFDWKVMFADVFSQSDLSGGGFDIVIGNPPYIALQRQKNLSKIYESQAYETYNKSSDIYCLFTEQGFRLLKPEGTLCYIMSNKWMQADYGESLRKFLLSKRIHHIIDFGDLQLFKDAVTYTCIVLASSADPAEDFKACFQKEFDLRNVSDHFETYKTDDLDSDAWVLTSRKELLLHKRIKKDFPMLRSYLPAEPNYGIKTGLTKAFTISKETRDKLVSDDPDAEEVIVPFVSGKDIVPYTSGITSKYLILLKKGFTKRLAGRDSLPEAEAWALLESRYPSVCEWLKPFEREGRDRSDMGDFWWELRPCVYYDQFEKPKIIYQAFQVKPDFYYDRNGMLCNNSTWILPTDNLALLGFLNSKLCWWLVSRYCSRIQGGFQLIWDYFSQIPVAPLDDSKVAGLVESILKYKTDDPFADTASLERQIDFLIYEAYGLTNGDIRAIDPDSSIVGADRELFNGDLQFAITPDKRLEGIFTTLDSRFGRICDALQGIQREEVDIEEEYCLHSPEKPSRGEAQDAFLKWNCAILTAFRGSKTLSREENFERNKKRNAELAAKMKEQGLEFRPVDGYYKEAGYEQYVKELSFFVTNVSADVDGRIDRQMQKEFFTKIYRLSEQYEQDCFLFTFPGRNRVAFQVATNEDGRNYFHNDTKYVGPLYDDIKEELDAWTSFSDGKMSFLLKGMMLNRRTDTTGIYIGEGDVLDAEGYNHDGVIVICDKTQKELIDRCMNYSHQTIPLVKRVLDQDVLDDDSIVHSIEDAFHEMAGILDKNKNTRRNIGLHFSVPFSGDYVIGARAAYKAILENARVLRGQLVIVDCYEEFYRAMNMQREPGLTISCMCNRVLL